jgi:hypothetical protein
VHDVATAGIDTIKLHIDTGVNKRIIKVDRGFCLKKRRLALALCRQTGTKKPGTKNVQCSGENCCTFIRRCHRLWRDDSRHLPCRQDISAAASDAGPDTNSTDIFLTDNRAT